MTLNIRFKYVFFAFNLNLTPIFCTHTSKNLISTVEYFYTMQPFRFDYTVLFSDEYSMTSLILIELHINELSSSKMLHLWAKVIYQHRNVHLVAYS